LTHVLFIDMVTMTMKVLDSFALIAYLEDEKGAEIIEKLMRTAQQKKESLLMSLINWGEVYYLTFREKGRRIAEETLLLIEQLPITIVPPDRELTLKASELKAQNSLVFADCFAAALAMEKDMKIVTGDPEFRKIKDRVAIEWL
jgi:predicted nucleic acid-binding protein